MHLPDNSHPRFTPSLLFFLLSLFTFAASFSPAADAPVEPSGVYKTIDTRLCDDTVKALREYQGEKRQAVVDAVIAKPEDFAPPVFYFLSSVLFQQGKKDEAVFWFCAGHLRARIDANICADKTAAKIIYAFNGKFGLPINQYTSTNMSVLTNTMERVLAWEEKTPCHYDRRWINLHGMKALNGDADPVLSAPLDQWEAIRKRTREEFAAEFHKAMIDFNQAKH